MVAVKESVLRDPARLEAVRRARRVMPSLPIPLDATARLAARLLDAPMGLVTLVGDDEEYFGGVHGLPVSLTAGRHAPIAYSVCKYVVGADHPVRSGDMLAGDAELRDHPLATEYGVRAFLAVPLRDGDDQPVGALTVLDTAVREWPERHVTTLVQVADLLGAVPVDTPPPSAAVAGLDVASLLGSVQEAFLAVNPAGVVVGWNAAARDLLGFDAEEVCGRHLDASILPDYDGRPVDQALARLFAAAPTNRRVTRQVSLRRKDGHRVTARVSISTVRGSAGSLACAFLTDLSDQTAARDEVDRHASFLDALLDSLSVGVIACGSDGRIVLVNRALRDVHQLPEAGRVTDAHTDAAVAMLRDAHLRPMTQDQTPLMRAWRGAHVQETDVVVAAPGRPVRTFATNAQPISGSDGRRLGAVATALEVTELRRAERFRACHQAVDRALRRADSAVDAAPEVLEAVATTLGWPHAELWLIDELTDSLQAVGHWSAPGLRLDDLLGGTVTKGVGITGTVWATGQPLWAPDIATSVHLATGQARARAQDCLRHGLRTVLSVPVRDGDTLLGVLTCYAGAPEQHEDLLVVLLDGIAAQLGVHVALRRAEQLARQLERSKDDFIALVGHELRTPLTTVAAYAALLMEDPATLDDDQRAMLRAIERNAIMLRHTVDTLLDLAGLDSGHLTLSIAEVDLAEIVVAASRAAAPAATAQGLRLHTDVPARLVLDGDRRRLRQVVDNLLSNATRYSPPGGDVHVSLAEEQDMVRLRVTDTGIGIPAAERDRLFERFFRASNVRHQGTTGAGLGLSLVRLVVHLHGGGITVTEHQPAGTDVLVRLPRRVPGQLGTPPR